MTVADGARRSTSRRTHTVIYPLVVCVVVVLLSSPTLLMLLGSLQDQTAIYVNPLGLPDVVQWGNYQRAWDLGGLPTRFRNSVVSAVGSVALSTSTGLAAAYVCARSRARRTAAFLSAFFALGLVIPIQSGIVPLFLEMRWLGLNGTLAPLILVNAALQLPLTILLLTAAIKGIPTEIEDAASVDGAGSLRILVSVVTPLIRPALTTAIILALVTVWNDYFLALVFASSTDLQTLPLGLSSFRQTFSTDWPGALAYSVIVAAPVLLLYVLLQRRITDGMVAGAIK